MRPAIIHYGNKNESRRSECSFARVIVVAGFISVQLTTNSDDKKPEKGKKKKKEKREEEKKDTIMNSLSLSLSLSSFSLVLPRTYRGFLRNTKAMIRQDVAL